MDAQKWRGPAGRRHIAHDQGDRGVDARLTRNAAFKPMDAERAPLSRQVGFSLFL